jgi:PhzF family phenazine biosynthesis protein
MNYYHVDVFSEKPLSGNGLSVVFVENNMSERLLLKIAQEFKQFETAFVYEKTEGIYPVRIFTVQEELPFAGHPVLGTAAVIHKVFEKNNFSADIKMNLGKRTVFVKSKIKGPCFSVEMNQGTPEFINTISQNDINEIAGCFNLSKNDISTEYPIEVVSTGLPYLLLPVETNLEKAKIMQSGLEDLISDYKAKFVYLFNPATLECRTWDNTGIYEDIATGSAAGPLIAYLVKNGYFQKGENITLTQGKHLKRESRLTGRVTDTKEAEVIIEGMVAFFSEGKITMKNFS